MGRLGPRLGRAVRGRVLVYYFVAGVVDENRILSRASTLAPLGFGVAAVVLLMRIFLQEQHERDGKRMFGEGRGL